MTPESAGCRQNSETTMAHTLPHWEVPWTANSPGRYSLAVRATDEKNNTQPDEPVWNPGGYLWNRIERQDIVVGNAG